MDSVACSLYFLLTLEEQYFFSLVLLEEKKIEKPVSLWLPSSITLRG